VLETRLVRSGAARLERRAALTFLSAVLLTSSIGCGGVYYAVNVTSASAKVAEARELGAEQMAPYEYHYAKAHLEQAQVEASEASYSDAANFAETAEEYANRAIEVTRAGRARRSGDRQP
jgi:hypothetical protein